MTAAPTADATQALRAKKKIKAMIRISPSKPPPMYMEFPLFIDATWHSITKTDALFVRYRTLSAAEYT